MSLTPPSQEEVDQAALVLKAPTQVEQIKDEEAQGAFNQDVSDDVRLDLSNRARGFVRDIARFNPNSPEFTSKLAEVQALARTEIEASGAGSNRMLERAASSVAGSKNGGDATQKVAKTLSELRNTVSDLTPNGADLTGVHKFLGFIPGGKKLTRYFQRYESAQVQLDQIVKSLIAGQDELRMDNASLLEEKQNQWKTMGKLNEYILLTDSLKTELKAEIVRLKDAGNVQAAQTLESDMLFAVTQRHQDLLTQLSVSAQGYMAMDLVRRNNDELIKGVERARTTTLHALRTAVIVAQALDNQKLVLDQIDSVNEVTNNTIARTGEMLKQQTARVHQQATNSGVSVATLEKAFKDIFDTMEAIDTFKVQANESMEQTITALGSQLERTKPYLERTRALESAEGSNPSQLRLGQ